MAAHTNLVLARPQYYFSQLILSGNSFLTMNSGGQHLDINVDYKVDLCGGGTLINTATVASQLSVREPASP